MCRQFLKTHKVIWPRVRFVILLKIYVPCLEVVLLCLGAFFLSMSRQIKLGLSYFSIVCWIMIEESAAGFRAGRIGCPTSKCDLESRVRLCGCARLHIYFTSLIFFQSATYKAWRSQSSIPPIQLPKTLIFFLFYYRITLPLIIPLLSQMCSGSNMHKAVKD